jgi:hypothetical protein
MLRLNRVLLVAINSFLLELLFVHVFADALPDIRLASSNNYKETAYGSENFWRFKKQFIS